MNKILILSFLTFYFLLSTFNCFAQLVQQEWAARYNNPYNDNDRAIAIALDGSGNVYVTGWTVSGPEGNNIVTVKYSASGIQQWAATYNTTGGQTIDIAEGLAVDSSGNVYVTGYKGFNFGPYDIVTIKYNNQGVQQWVRIYDSGGDDGPREIIMDTQGNVIVTGTSTIKYNPSGDSLWVRRYPSSVGYSVKCDDSNNVYVGVYTGKFLAIKYNSNGVQQWATQYNGPGGPDGPSKLVLDNNRNVYMTGGTSRGAPTYVDYLTVKFSPTGVVLWASTYNGTGNDYDVAYDLAVDNFGNVYVTGDSPGIPGTQSDYVTIKYNSVGDSLWIRRHNGPASGDDEAYALTIDTLANVYITGRSVGIGIGYDYATIKYNSSGIQQWVIRYNGQANSDDLASALVIDRTGNVYVTGSSDNGGFQFDYATIKYSQTVGVVSSNSEIPSKYLLGQNYPNPFNGKSNIKYQISKSCWVGIKICDISGKTIKVLIDQNQPAGSYKTSYSDDQLSSGVYFYSLFVNGEKLDTKKMILIK